MAIFKESLNFWSKVVIVSIIQIGLGFIIFDLYPVLSMLLLGEGGDSLLYSKGNSIMWALSPIILPFIFNSNQILNGLGDKTATTIKMYKIIGVVVFIVYLIFIIWQAKTRGFHI